VGLGICSPIGCASDDSSDPRIKNTDVTSEYLNSQSEFVPAIRGSSGRNSEKFMQRNDRRQRPPSAVSVSKQLLLLLLLLLLRWAGHVTRIGEGEAYTEFW